jgi:glutathione S-transferase
MKQLVTLHGLSDCPFAWRTRIAAEEKGAPFDWIPADVARPNPRAATENAERRSPLMIHDWLTLTESMVICQYIDDAFPGRPLLNEDPAKRALERLAMVELDFDLTNGTLPVDGFQAKLDAALDSLGVRLRETSWLGGKEPSLADIKLAPFLAKAVVKQHGTITSERTICRDYLARWQSRPSYARTRPPWAG